MIIRNLNNPDIFATKRSLSNLTFLFFPTSLPSENVSLFVKLTCKSAIVKRQQVRYQKQHVQQVNWSSSELCIGHICFNSLIQRPIDIFRLRARKVNNFFSTAPRK